MKTFNNADEIRAFVWDKNLEKNREAFHAVERFIFDNADDRKLCMEMANIAIHQCLEYHEPLSEEEYDQMLDEIILEFGNTHVRNLQNKS